MYTKETHAHTHAQVQIVEASIDTCRRLKCTTDTYCLVTVACLNICVYACMKVCVYIYAYVYVFIHIYRQVGDACCMYMHVPLLSKPPSIQQPLPRETVGCLRLGHLVSTRNPGPLRPGLHSVFEL